METPEDYEAAWPEAVEKCREAVAKEHDEVVAAGGLYVLGTERHESRRIDNQLRGRSGRQGDPGESRFYLSLEDELMVRFNGDKIAHLMQLMKTPPDMPLESKPVSRAIRSAQSNVESLNFEIRKDVLKYDDVMNRQRKVVYQERRSVLEGADLKAQISGMIDDVVEGYVKGATGEGFPEEWDLDKLWRALKQLYPVGLTIDQLTDEAGGERSHLTGDFIAESAKEDAHAAYTTREQELTPEVMREVERRVVLSVLDRRWREHLYEMDYLREGVSLRGYGQRDPLIEYQREGYDMFAAMMDGIKEDTVGSLFNLQVQVQQNPIMAEDGAVDAVPAGPTISLTQSAQPVAGQPGAAAVAPVGADPVAAQPPRGTVRRSPRRARRPRPDASQPARQQQAAVASGEARPCSAGPPRAWPGRSAAGISATAPRTRTRLAPRRTPRVRQVTSPTQTWGRNAQCPCGSGKKFKQCHGDPRNR